MNINIDFQAAIDRAFAPEAMAPILDKHLTAAITSAIQDATGYRSKFSEELKTQLAEALPHGLSVQEIAKFQHILNQTMNTFVGDANRASVETALAKAVGHVMPTVPAVLKLSEFMTGVRAGLHIEEHEAFYAFMKVSTYGSTYVCIDSDPNPGRQSYSDRADRQHRAKYQLSVSEQGDVYAMRLDGVHLTPSKLPNVVGSFEDSLMAMYVGRTKLQIDMDDDELESLSAEQDPS